ncbi:Pro-rich N-terminal domain-containing protein [Streptomyces platensis]|uniref:Pro-rich N-terminal domain-containing protein n=2 Tax=Streptomyces platensis TaxID=58346 RepID=UPI00386F537D|nr:ATP-binding protein [Streptomyces platensis]
MHYAVGAPLPPPRGQASGPGASMHWTPHPGGHTPGGHHPPASPPAPSPPPQAPAAPPPPAQQPAPAGQGWHGPAPQQAPPTQHSMDVTGHVPLPPGAPVPLPSPPTDAAPDAAHTAVAVLLIGPAGAGKTSVARHWADTRRVPTAHISLDDVREWVRSGFADPQSGWNDHSEAQYRLARRTCGFAARNFLANGISCILDDAVFPDRPVVGLGGWKRHVGPGLLPIVLLPGLEIVLERNARRSGNRRLSDEEVARIHGRMAGWYGSGLPIIDNSQHDVATTVRVLDDVVARSIASPPNW